MREEDSGDGLERKGERLGGGHGVQSGVFHPRHWGQRGQHVHSVVFAGVTGDDPERDQLATPVGHPMPPSRDSGS